MFTGRDCGVRGLVPRPSACVEDRIPMRSSALTALAIACHLSLPVPSVHAQQPSRPGSTSPARRGYFSRVQTESGAASPATGGSPPPLRPPPAPANAAADPAPPPPPPPPTP